MLAGCDIDSLAELGVQTRWEHPQGPHHAGGAARNPVAVDPTKQPALKQAGQAWTQVDGAGAGPACLAWRCRTCHGRLYRRSAILVM
jgi:hypothetical protein